MGNLDKAKIDGKNNMVGRVNLLTADVAKGVFGSALTAKSVADSIDKPEINDKYKHSYVSCKTSQAGGISALTAGALGVGKELIDYKKGKNSLAENIKDLTADAYGIYKGYTNPQGDCDEMVQRRYQKLIK